MKYSVVVFLTVLISVLVTAVLQPLVEQQVLGSFPLFTRRLLNFAARQLPADARNDLLAEWAGELDTLVDRPLSALSFSLGLALTTWKTAPELPPSRRQETAPLELPPRQLGALAESLTRGTTERYVVDGAHIHRALTEKRALLEEVRLSIARELRDLKHLKFEGSVRGATQARYFLGFQLKSEQTYHDKNSGESVLRYSEDRYSKLLAKEKTIESQILDLNVELLGSKMLD